LTGKVKREEKRIQKTECRRQKTEWTPDPRFWILEIPGNQSPKHETMKARKIQGRQETGVSRRSRTGILEKWNYGMMRRRRVNR
jgi:hypothetical protein